MKFDDSSDVNDMDQEKMKKKLQWLLNFFIFFGIIQSDKEEKKDEWLKDNNQWIIKIMIVRIDYHHEKIYP